MLTVSFSEFDPNRALAGHTVAQVCERLANWPSNLPSNDTSLTRRSSATAEPRAEFFVKVAPGEFQNP